MPEQFDHYQYDADEPAWKQRRVGGYSASVQPEGGWMAIPTLLGWLNIISGVLGLLAISFGIVFVVLVLGGASVMLLPLIAGGAFVMLFSLFYMRLGQGLIRREEWSRWVTIVFSVLGLLVAPCSGISLTSQMQDPRIAELPGSLQAMSSILSVGALALGVALNIFVIYVLVRRDVSVHFRPGW